MIHNRAFFLILFIIQHFTHSLLAILFDMIVNISLSPLLPGKPHQSTISQQKIIYLIFTYQRLKHCLIYSKGRWHDRSISEIHQSYWILTSKVRKPTNIMNRLKAKKKVPKKLTSEMAPFRHNGNIVSDGGALWLNGARSACRFQFHTDIS